jgi:pimeloyl-ACP methyl ester carboxylesterase
LIKERCFFELAETRIAYTMFKEGKGAVESSSAPRRLLLLHGAGVAGELTWTFIVNYLKHWDEILVPDLLGMGDSYFDALDHLPFSIEDISQSLFSLLAHYNWHSFDLAGYSLGGLVALEMNEESKRLLHSKSNKEPDDGSSQDYVINSLCLIEPALFSDQSLQASLLFRQSFTPLAANIKADPSNEKHFIDFLDLVSPNRISSPKMDELAVQRLQKRPLGFAHALAAVSNYADCLTDTKLKRLISSIPIGLGIVGGLSNPGLLHAQQNIQSQQKNWHIESLANTDHSLIYVRPKNVAKLINQYLGDSTSQID